MPIEWRPAMSIDGGAIDDDHRFLIRLINQFEVALAGEGDVAEVLKVLGSLKYYTVYHFVREEAAQKAADYPSHQNHAKEHKRLVECVDTAIAMLENYVPGEKFDAVRSEVSRLLRTWLIDHILKHDIQMRPYVRKMNRMTRDYAPISAISSAGR